MLQKGASPARGASKTSGKTPTKAAPKATAKATLKATPKKVKTPPKVDSEAGPSNCGPPPMGEANQRVLRLNGLYGDLFGGVPANSVLIHSCNCLGSWGDGIAREFRTRYPNAYQAYKSHCEASTPATLLGMALLIQPGEGDPSHWIACLFTSKKGGAAHDPKDKMLSNTEKSMRNLLQHLYYQEAINKMSFSQLRMPKINAGIFGVPWAETDALLNGMVLRNSPVKEGVGDGDTLIQVYDNAPMTTQPLTVVKGKRRADKPPEPQKPKKKQKKA